VPLLGVEAKLIIPSVKPSEARMKARKIRGLKEPFSAAEFLIIIDGG